MQEHTAEASGVDWNLVSKDCFASCSWDHTVKGWEPERLVLLATLAEHTSCVYEVKWHPSHPERLLSASGDRTVRLWEPRAGPSAQLTCVAGERDSQTLYGRVLAKDVLLPGSDKVLMAAGTHISDQQVRDLRAALVKGFDPETGEVTEVATGFDRPQHLLAMPDGSVLLTVHGSGQLVRLTPPA